jgi:UDP-N-acetylmuramoyl-L-alanyl-D-glutamate--2,6-diaminopimelate ligase
MQLRTILDRLAPWITALAGDPSVDVTGVVDDSRHVRPGVLFVARAGGKTDGRRFVAQAVDAGCAAVLSDGEPVAEARGIPWIRVTDARRAAAYAAAAFHNDPARDVAVDFVTGTNGKTSLTYLCEGILAAAGISAGAIGTVSRRFAGREVASAMTTPDAPELQGMLAEMRDAGVHRVIMELSSHAIDQDRWEPIAFRVGIFTNAARDHIDYHGTVEAYHAVKVQAFTRVLAGSPRRVAAVVNVDDPLGRTIAAACEGRVLTVSLDGPADVRVEGADYGIGGTTLHVLAGGERFDVTSPLVGRHNGYNLACAVGYGLALGLSPQTIADGLARVARVPGRLDAVLVNGEARVLVDYAHTPDAIENVLQALRTVTTDRLVIVFGAGGDRDRGKRPLMGAAAQRLADVCLVTSDNPRSEEPRAIVDEILAGMTPGPAVMVEVDRREAIRQAVAMLDGRTVVLLAGKGHEPYQIVGDRVLDFDDRAEALAALRDRGLA